MFNEKEYQELFKSANLDGEQILKLQDVYADFDENNIMISGRLTYNGKDFRYGHGYLNVTEYMTGKQIIKRLQISLDFCDKDIRNKLNRILKINAFI